MSFVIEGKQNVENARILTIRSALKLEVNTGMKMSRGVNILKVAQSTGITTAKTKKGALEDFNAYIKENFGL